MSHPFLAVTLVLAALCGAPALGSTPGPATAPAAADSAWTLYLLNDTCPDYTWGLTQDQTRKAFADLIAAHLDEMQRADGANLPPESRNRYNAAVTQEILCFVQHYPARKEELIRRIKEGRLFVSPFLCNSLWGFQSFESAVRTLYPARRLERDWGLPRHEWAQHIECPSLPWGQASILAGCGVRWVSVPFYNYDSTFKNLTSPPLFTYEGPDGRGVRVILDSFASNRASYTQAAALLKEPATIEEDWLPHYAKLGPAYPLKAIFASGTHGDIAPNSSAQVRGFADGIARLSQQTGGKVRAVNATLPQFCNAIDAAQNQAPFLPTLRGCFGHSWELWPVSLARTVADLRESERQFLAAEALLTLAIARKPDLPAATRADRQKAEWCLAMLSDHAWNGADDANRRHNADLRQHWAQALGQTADTLRRQAFAAVGLQPDTHSVVLFNPSTMPRRGLIRLPVPTDVNGVTEGEMVVPAQVQIAAGQRFICFVSPEVPGLGFRILQLITQGTSAGADKLRATATELESPFYALKLDPARGAIASLRHKLSGKELGATAVPGRAGEQAPAPALGEVVYFQGQEHRLADVKAEVLAPGPVFARVAIRGSIPAAGITVTQFLTVYSHLDQLDIELLITKPPKSQEERLCHYFPLLGKDATLRLDTPGAVIRPRPQPAGDLLPGADPRRFAVGSFLDFAAPDAGVTLVPLDAFALRLDLGAPAFEVLGNDQNYKEVTRDQGGNDTFRFRYVLRGRAGDYRSAEVISFARGASLPLLATLGKLDPKALPAAGITLDPARAVATCLKPADDPKLAEVGVVLRLQEVAGRSGPLRLPLSGYHRAILTDLLERDQRELPIENGAVQLDLPAHGFAAVRLER